MMCYDAVAIARQFAFVHEAQQLGQNKGTRVEAIQHWSLGQPGDSWCAEFATMVLDLCFQGDSPVGRLQACEDIHSLAAEKHWLAATPAVGDLVLSINADGRAHHVGIVTATHPLTAIAGNTSRDGASSNGDGVYEHTISPSNKLYVHYPR
jgi:hypothetical protein